TIYGTGEQSRCFGYVGDVIEAITLLMEAPGAYGRVFNVGATEEISINALADRIIGITGSRSTKRYLSYEEAYGRSFDDMHRRVPCLSRIKSTIDWTPRTSLDEILNFVVDDMRGRDAAR